MQIKFIKIMNLKFLFIVTVLLFLLCCNRYNNDKCVTLFLDITNSEYNDERFLIDSINICYNDSIRIVFHMGDYRYIRVFYKHMNGIYEIRERFNEEMKYFGTDTILTFSKSDTTFIFRSEFDFIPAVFYYAFADCKYEILRENNTFKSIKKSLVDTTYKEIFFYDKNYNIFKYTNTWQDNHCVYVKK